MTLGAFRVEMNLPNLKPGLKEIDRGSVIREEGMRTILDEFCTVQMSRDSLWPA